VSAAYAERMRHLSTLVCVLIVSLLVSACGATEVRGDVTPRQMTSRDCLAQWNAGENETNRSIIAGSAAAWHVEVSLGIINHPAADKTGEQCSYLFSTESHWISFTGSWNDDGTFEWSPGLTQRGQREPGQQIEDSGYTIDEDGRLR
jgi:hypothetical protein